MPSTARTAKGRAVDDQSGSARRRSTARQRVLAIVSFVATAALVAETVVFLLRNGVYALLGAGGLLLALVGAWWMLTGRIPRRAVGIAGMVVGIGALAGAMWGAASGAGAALRNILLAVALLSVAVVSARAALAGSLHEAARLSITRVAAPVHPVLLCNPWSGGGKVQRFGIAELANSLGVETVMLDRGLDLEELARDAVARGADCLGMAGGDGSQALVASIAVEHDLPFVCVSAGTRNHFALDLGIDREDPRNSVYAFRDALERRIDYATVNGRFFVNNVSLGVYATIVQQDEYREAKSETTRRLLPELLGRTDQPFDLQFTAPDGSAVDGSFLIQVSNNPYVMGASLDVSQRRRIDTGALGVFAITATTGAQAAQVVTLALAGRSAASGHAYEFTTGEFEVRSRSGKAFAGIDGEALELETPLRFAIHPKGLRLLVPEGNAEVVARRQAHEVHLGDLVRIVRGQAPATAAAG
jgi:diacylglycerol kinase family enzyme